MGSVNRARATWWRKLSFRPCEHGRANGQSRPNMRIRTVEDAASGHLQKQDDTSRREVREKGQ